MVSYEINPPLYRTRHDSEVRFYEVLDGLRMKWNYIRGGGASIDAVRLEKKDLLWKATPGVGV